MKKRLLVILLGLLVLLTASYFLTPPVTLYQAAMTLEQKLAGLQSKSVEVQGQRWEYLEGGQGEPLLLLHGFSADANNWARLSRTLGDHYRIIAPDLLGFGNSAKPLDAAYDIASQAERVFAFANAIGLERFDLGGSSMGGYIAGVMSAQQPQRIRSLWLLAPGGVLSAPNSEMFELILTRDENPLIVRTVEDFDFTYQFIFSQPPFLPGRVKRGFAERQLSLLDIYERIFSAIRYDSSPLEDALRDSTTPALIVWGEQDRVLHPGGGPALQKVMATASLKTMPGVGHLPMIESPRPTAGQYMQWRAEQKF